ncbi:SEC7-like protein [Lasiodiplodia theobromae]|uniref:PH and SEC7 domain-containing protein n=1 Tax=Lasiodiplodia theobromae TaxID=45133 RepID=A0A5N5DFB4_9PEZI|nr:SEC7-like protein [Lasiodiplodia theobromae]KAB2576337.1 PH and SEC7 domain-containing protein [Lasiodiplodia theobromae]KAF4533892.1 SEC7-like protein [Lasiodiplodia theobromae]KAF9638184.1 SEC7-like protein [Lasiodiplodia theobromae]
MRDDSPPRTPTQHKGKAPMRALETHQAANETTFFDDDTPVDKRRSGATELSIMSRDSHDLHFRDVTRESVVDNMLLSLDSLHTGPAHFGGMYNGFDDAEEPFQSSVSRFSPPPHFRSPAHTHSPSLDYDPHDDSSVRYAPLRGRRSNSTSNFRSDLDKVESRGYGSARMSSDTARKPVYGEGAFAQHGRGRGSKGSSSSSMDYGYSTQVLPPGSRHTNRSASFDNGYDRRPFGSDEMSPSSVYSSVLNRGRPNVLDFSAYDAAPTPTIPTRPRRFEDPPSPAPHFDYASQQSPFGSLPVHVPAVPAPSSRRNSIRSSSSKGPWNGKARGPDASIRAQATEFVNAVNIRELPPIPAFADNTTPGKPPSTPQAKEPPKERRGFFSRVFGGGRSQPPQEPRATPQLPPIDTRSPEQAKRPSTTPAQNYTPQNGARPAVRQSSITQPQKQPTDPQQQPRTLTKKNSSFFRRRKKSVTEDPLPPPVPVQVQRVGDIGTSVLPSPAASSLRNAMKDYLVDQQAATPREAYYDTRELQSPVGDGDDHPGGFSPEYTPHKDATIRTVRPGSRGTDDGVAPAVEDLQDLHHRTVDSPKYKLKVRRGKGGSARANDDSSFLADSSEQEDKAGHLSAPSRGQNMYVPEQSRRPATSPNASTQHTSSAKENLGPRQKANVGEKRTDAHPSSSAGQRFADGTDEEGWVITTPSRRETADSDINGKNNRVWLEPTSSEEKLEQTSLSLPLEGAKSEHSPADRSPITPSDAYQSASSLPIVQVEGGDVRTSAEVVRTAPATASEEPTDEDREKAQQIYDGDENFLAKGKAAAWLGENTIASARCRKAYMEIYEWTGFSILLAMRDLCNRLVLKGETQQVDRILDSFANRWCECNPNHGFKSPGAVHTICYSLLLLNTDLHMADIESRMTRGQFVKNTLPTIRSVVDAELEEAEEHTHSRSQTPVEDNSTPISPTFENRKRPSVDLNTKRSKNRLSIRPAMGLRMDPEGYPTNPDSGAGDACTVLVKAPFEGSMKAWEFQVEIVLKEFYSSIKSSKLPLHGVDTTPAQSSNNLSVTGVLRRTPSVLSKAPSDTTSYRGRHSEFRAATARWNSKTRSRPKLYPNSTIGSSRTSLDDQSVFSPAGSSKWSTYSMGKTGTSMSVDSLGTHFSPPDYQQSIGFANALSQAIIREGNEENHTIASYEEYGRTAPLLEDESLELHGPPWAKEGILKHKHHLEAMDKKSKDRHWNEVFAVIEKGYMKVFTFNMNAKKAKRRPSAHSVVGGGNWTDNAEELHSFLLRQTMASTLPPPGYSKTRPHVFALSLPTGAVHLFQAGTADIVREYVQTANYWSARLSKEPLVGGVSNIEYGWSDNVINMALISRPESSPTTIGNNAPRQSIQSSIRSSMDHGTMKPRLPGDKVVLSDWTPPTQSMMASNLMEVDQHKALSAYVKNVEEEMQRHQELRAPLMIAFSPRHPNAAKAMANFEKKSAYLLRELVKFKTYIDALDYANEMRDKIYKEREERLKAEEAAKKEEGQGDEGACKDEDDMSASALAQSYSSLMSAFDSPVR